jgi:hypothetical protein
MHNIVLRALFILLAAATAMFMLDMTARPFGLLSSLLA